MIRLCVYVLLMFFNYQSKAEDVCKASPIQQGKYLNRRPPKNWSNCFGEYIYLNSVSVYKGLFLNGKPDGIGSLDNIAGSSYVGEWKDGTFHGKGIIKNSDGTSYDGSWINSRFLGYGTITIPNIGKITGIWNDVIITGNFTIIHNDDHIYSGFLVNGVRDGYGILQYPDEGKYEGEWLNGKQHGKGTLTPICRQKRIFWTMAQWCIHWN